MYTSIVNILQYFLLVLYKYTLKDDYWNARCLCSQCFWSSMWKRLQRNLARKKFAVEYWNFLNLYGRYVLRCEWFFNNFLINAIDRIKIKHLPQTRSLNKGQFAKYNLVLFLVQGVPRNMTVCRTT